MSQVFLSYKREDETRVGRIAAGLSAAGLEVWWDRGLPGGESWHANIEANLDKAGCVIVVWSAGAAAPEGHYVRDEARRGLARGILVPVTIDRLKDLPLGFGEVQAIDLSRWRGDARDPFFQDLVAAVRAKLAGAATPAPTGPARRVARRILAGGVSSAGAAALAAVAFNVFGAASVICTAPGLQPGLSDACGAVRLGERPSHAERLAWAAIPAGSCPALRAHIARFPEGAYRREAADLLTARRVSEVTQWSPVQRQLVIYFAGDGPRAASDAGAKAAALAAARPAAERVCRGFGSGTLYRFVSAEAQAQSWTCRGPPTARVCGFDGVAACALLQRQDVETERCGPVR